MLKQNPTQIHSSSSPRRSIRPLPYQRRPKRQIHHNMAIQPPQTSRDRPPRRLRRLEPLPPQRLHRLRRLLRDLRIRQSPSLLRLHSQILRRLTRQPALPDPDSQTGRDRTHRRHQTALRHRAHLFDARGDCSLGKPTGNPTPPQPNPKRPLQVPRIPRRPSQARSAQSRHAAELLRSVSKDL